MSFAIRRPTKFSAGTITQFLPSSPPQPWWLHQQNRVQPLKVRRLSVSRSKQPNLRERLRARYPDISLKDLPSVTFAFLVLHELTAIVPLVGAFGVLHASGAGQAILVSLKRALDHAPDHTVQVDEGRVSSEGALRWLGSLVGDSLEDGSQWISRIAARYGWIPNSGLVDQPSPDLNAAVQANGSWEGAAAGLDGSVVASGLIAYLFVKALLPVRIGLSLYLAPTCARSLYKIFSFIRRKPIDSQKL